MSRKPFNPRNARQAVLPHGGIDYGRPQAGIVVRDYANSKVFTNLTPEADVRRCLVGAFKFLSCHISQPLVENEQLSPSTFKMRRLLATAMGRYQISWDDWYKQLWRMHTALQDAAQKGHGRVGGFGGMLQIMEKAGFDERLPPATVVFFALLGMLWFYYVLGLEDGMIKHQLIVPGKDSVGAMMEHLGPILMNLQSRRAATIPGGAQSGG